MDPYGEFTEEELKENVKRFGPRWGCDVIRNNVQTAADELFFRAKALRTVGMDKLADNLAEVARLIQHLGVVPHVMQMESLGDSIRASQSTSVSFLALALKDTNLEFAKRLAANAAEGGKPTEYEDYGPVV